MLLLLATCAGASEERTEDPLDKVLFIGNSFTYYNNGLHAHFRRLTFAAGLFTRENSRARIATISGGHLPEHEGGFEQVLGTDDWDVVVLQQGPSATEGRPYLLDFADAFADEIRAAGGVPALYMVWPSKARFFDFDGVLDSYRTAADSVDGYFFPAGEAWRVASPIELLPINVPTVLVHGSADDAVPPSQSERYASAAANNGTTELVLFEGDHFDPIDPTSAAWAEVIARL